MDIKNVTQFSAFISNNGLMELDQTFRQVIICMADFSRHCNCHNRTAKDIIYKNCNILYNQGAKIAAGKFKNEFLAKTTERNISFFADNGELIAIVSR